MTTNVNQTKIELVPTGIGFKVKVVVNGHHVANLIRTGKPGDARFSYLILTPHVWGKGWTKLATFEATTETKKLVSVAIREWIIKKFS